MNYFKIIIVSLLCLVLFTGCIKKTVVTAGKIVEMAVLLPIAGVAYAVKKAKGDEENKESTKEDTNKDESKENVSQDDNSVKIEDTDKTSKETEKAVQTSKETIKVKPNQEDKGTNKPTIAQAQVLNNDNKEEVIK